MKGYNMIIEPQTGTHGAALEEAAEAARTFLKVIELERSGVRDGDGSWHGSCPVEHVMDELDAKITHLRCARYHWSASQWGEQTAQVASYSDSSELPF
jgi:hypothetical protein